MLTDLGIKLSKVEISILGKAIDMSIPISLLDKLEIVIAKRLAQLGILNQKENGWDLVYSFEDLASWGFYIPLDAKETAKNQRENGKGSSV